jgi:Rrf2 family protein
VHISARVEYAMRAVLVLATSTPTGPVPARDLAGREGISAEFLETILLDLRHAGIVAEGREAAGYRLARPPDEVSVAEVIRAVDGPLAEVHGLRPEAVRYAGPSEHLREVWVAVRANLRAVLESVSLAEIASGDLPPTVRRLTADPDAWKPH